MDQNLSAGLDHIDEKMKMNKQQLNATIFFSIVYWLGLFFLVFKFKVIPVKTTVVAIVVMVVINLLIFALYKVLEPVFRGLLFVTGYIGKFIFGVISTIVFYFILTPIALFKRLTGKSPIPVKIDKTAESYYEPWEPSEGVDKQY